MSHWSSYRIDARHTTEQSIRLFEHANQVLSKFSSGFPSLPTFIKHFCHINLPLSEPFGNVLKISWYLSVNTPECFPDNSGILFHSHNTIIILKKITDSIIHLTSSPHSNFPIILQRLIAVFSGTKIRIQLRYTHCSSCISLV